MRISPVLALLAVVLPTSLNAGPTSGMRAKPDLIAMFHEQWGFVQEAKRDRDLKTLRGLLEPDGIKIASMDPTIPQGVLTQAAREWNQALGMHVVTVVKTTEDADVTVRIVDGIGDHQENQGIIEVFKTDDGMLSAEISLDGQASDRALTVKEMGAVVTHELGHYLGLDDLEGDSMIMGEFDPQHLIIHPSPREAEAVLNLRDRIEAVIRDIQALK